MSKVRLFDCVAQYSGMRREMQAAIRRVLNSGNLILGDEVRSFEEEFAEYLGAKGQCVGVASGTDALIVCMMALGISRGDEVITVANTAVPTVSAVRSVGATPVFCDVDERTCLMDLDMVKGLVTPRTRAVIPVHLFGNVVDVKGLRSVLGGRRISIIEDCAQAHGAEIGGRKAGTLGDASAFSFYPTKNLGAYGDGGMCWSPDRDLAREMRKIRMYGFDGRHYCEREGINSRLDEIQAAVLRVKLKRLDEWVERRRRLAAVYGGVLLPEIGRAEPGPRVRHAYHLYVIKTGIRDKLRERLDAAGIGTAIHYPFPIHLMKGYEFLGYAKGMLPKTERLAGLILSLPMYPELEDGRAEYVGGKINEMLGDAG